MSLGDIWATTTPGSVSKLNKMTVISGTGAYLAALVKDNHTLYVCTSTGSGFTIDHVYLCSADGTTTFDLSQVQVHDHSATVEGGSLWSILKANRETIDSGSKYIFRPKKTDWVEVVDGTGSVADDVDGTSGEHSVKLATGATSASSSAIRIPSLGLDFSKNSFFKSLIKFGTASSIAARLGYGMQGLNEVDDNDRKYGAEVCTTVNNNWFIRTSTGSASSASDSGTSAMVTTRQVIRCDHFPDTPKVDLYINEGTAFTKTTNIPVTYSDTQPIADKIYRQVVKNNTAADRTMFCYGSRLVYQTTSTWF